MSTGITAIRKGRKAKSVVELPRSLKSLSLTSKKRKSYTREYKLQALTLLGRVRVGNDGAEETEKRISEVARECGITIKMLSDWKKNEAKIIASKKGSRALPKPRKAKWEEMEQQLYDRFMEVRGMYYYLKLV